MEFEPGTCVADETAGSTSKELTGYLHRRKVFATAWPTQICDIGSSDIVRSSDMRPSFIISIFKVQENELRTK